MMCRSSEIQQEPKTKSDPIQLAPITVTVYIPLSAPLPWCVDRSDLKCECWMKGGRKKTFASEKNMMKNNAWLVLYDVFSLSWFLCDSCWSVAVLIAGLLLEVSSAGSENGPPHHLLSCSGSCVPLLWRHLQPTASTKLSWTQNNSYFFWEKQRGDVCVFNFGSLRMDLFKVISAETNPPGEIAVSIAHDLLVFRGTSCIGIDF